MGGGAGRGASARAARGTRLGVPAVEAREEGGAHLRVSEEERGGGGRPRPGGSRARRRAGAALGPLGGRRVRGEAAEGLGEGGGHCEGPGRRGVWREGERREGEQGVRAAATQREAQERP